LGIADSTVIAQSRSKPCYIERYNRSTLFAKQ
jgi:hypothetical protein